MERMDLDIEEWAKRFDEELQESIEKGERRREENGLILCVIYDNELWDYGFNLFNLKSATNSDAE